MSVNFITQLILQYRYWILIPLSFIEGPIVAFVAGMLASLGYFNMYFLAMLFFVRDVGLDGVYYALGYFGGRTAFARRMLTRIGITPDHLEKVRLLWAKRPAMTLFIGKLSYGIASAFIVVAGMIRMPLRLFFAYGSIVAILQYGTLLFLGYFLGVSLGGNVVRIIDNVQYAVAFVAIAISAYYILTWSMRKKFLKEDKQIEESAITLER
ncbi:MAG: DedA family protein [Minisyncoccota bacterium]